MMIRSVNIDGKDYIIRSCEECPFYDEGDEGYGDRCQYPENPSKLEESGSWGMPNLKADFIPKVENPDPAQLERLKTMDGELANILRKFAEDALFTTEIRVDMPNKREKE